MVCVRADSIHKSFECVYIRTEFGIMLVCVRADKVKDHVSVFTFRYCLGPCTCLQSFGLYQCVNVWTEFGIM